MTGKELIKALQDLGDENLNRKIVMFDGPNYYTPCKVEVLKDRKWDKQYGCIMID